MASVRRRLASMCGVALTGAALFSTITHTHAQASDGAGLEATSGTVIHLHNDGFQRHVLPSDEMWAVAVLESEDKCGEACTAIHRVLEDVCVRSEGAFRIGYVNARELIVGPDGDHVPMAEAFNITHIPILMLYMPGPKRLEAAMRVDVQTSTMLLGSGKALYTNLRMFHPSIVPTVRAGNFAANMKKPFAALPRVLLLSSKKDVPLLVKKIAVDFASRAVVAIAYLSDAKVAEAFGLTTSSPTTLVVSPGGGIAVNESNPLAPGAYAHWSKFGGELKLQAVRQWLHAVLPLAPVPLLLNQNDFQQQCALASDINLCFIAILPTGALQDIADTRPAEWDAESAQGSGAVLRRVASRAFVKSDWNAFNAGEMKSERLPIAFMAVDGNTQDNFAEAFNAPTPGLIALNPRKKMFALYRGSFQEENLVDFIMGMIEKAAPAIPGMPPRKVDLVLETVDSIPTLVKQANPVKKSKPAASTKKTKTQKPGKGAAAAAGTKAKEEL